MNEFNRLLHRKDSTLLGMTKKYLIAYIRYLERSLDDAEPVVHARWVYDDEGNLICSHCGKIHGGGFCRCSYCGAKMDVEEAKIELEKLVEKFKRLKRQSDLYR